MNKTDYALLQKLPEAKRERAREYWRRWKERNAPKSITKFGWHADFKRELPGWNWKARKETNGAVLTNGPFETFGKAKMDFLQAVQE